MEINGHVTFFFLWSIISTIVGFALLVWGVWQLASNKKEKSVHKSQVKTWQRMKKKDYKPKPYVTFSTWGDDEKSAEDIIQQLAKEEAAINYTNAELWFFKAERLVDAAEKILSEEKHPVDQIPYMLFGLAIEINLKGLLIKKKKPLLKSDFTLFDEAFPDGFKSHDLIAMFKTLNIELTDPEKQVADKLRNSIENGRYPVAAPKNYYMNSPFMRIFGEKDNIIVNELGKKAELKKHGIFA